MPEPRLQLTGAVYFAPLGTPPPDEDAAFDQGDVCDEDGHAHDAPVTDGVCGWCGEGVGEWVELGYVEASGAAALRAEERARREHPIGPPLPVLGWEETADGWTANVNLPADHPAYAAVHEGLTDSLSIGPDGIAALSDNARSVTPVDTRSPVHASFRAVPVASPAVTTGLGREHIDTHRHIPAPGRVELPEALGGLAEDAPEQQLVRYNRADRRRAAKTMRKQARRG